MNMTDLFKYPDTISRELMIDTRRNTAILLGHHGRQHIIFQVIKSISFGSRLQLCYTRLPEGVVC